MKSSAMFTRAVELVKRQQPQPVPISERPWEREGWYDEQGRCLWTAGKFETLPLSWWLVNDPMSCTSGFMLPFHALPLPTTEA